MLDSGSNWDTLMEAPQLSALEFLVNNTCHTIFKTLKNFEDLLIIRFMCIQEV